jgi:hypothetical protein
MDRPVIGTLCPLALEQKQAQKGKTLLTPYSVFFRVHCQSPSERVRPVSVTLVCVLKYRPVSVTLVFVLKYDCSVQ